MKKLFLSAFFVMGTFCSSVHAQDLTNLGGALTSGQPRDSALQLPAPVVTDGEVLNDFQDGHTLFHQSYFDPARREILGEKFNHVSCAGCHVADGRGPVAFRNGFPGSSMIVKVATRNHREISALGPQLRDFDQLGNNYFNIKLAWDVIRGSYRDGERYKLRKPRLTFKIPDLKQQQTRYSLRMSPPVIGSGLLEAIAPSTLEQLSDPDDRNGDGISGEVSRPNPNDTGVVGRFGFKASHATVAEQSGAALFNDMGISNPIFSNNKAGFSENDLKDLVLYMQVAGIPPAQNQSDTDVIAGKYIFQQINCSGCHVLSIRTGKSDFKLLSNQEIHPLTDLLLHDMGKDLSDDKIEGSASGSEWRTTPLWGLGLYKVLSESQPGFLHDGRARSVEEAILWHGGEAKRSKVAFENLPKVMRQQLVKFLESL